MKVISHIFSLELIFIFNILKALTFYFRIPVIERKIVKIIKARLIWLLIAKGIVFSSPTRGRCVAFSFSVTLPALPLHNDHRVFKIVRTRKKFSKGIRKWVGNKIFYQTFCFILEMLEIFYYTITFLVWG